MNNVVVERSERYMNVEQWLAAIAEERMVWDHERSLHFTATRATTGHAVRMEENDHWHYAGDAPEVNKKDGLIRITGKTILWKSQNRRNRVYFCDEAEVIRKVFKSAKGQQQKTRLAAARKG